MNGRGGCCIAKYSHGGGGGGGGGGMSYGMSKVERIMLKFRPIAPKPLAAGSGSSCSTMENSDGYGGTRRRKRKYVRVNGNKAKKEKTTKVSDQSSPSVSDGGDTVVTLSLLPEIPDRKENSLAVSSPTEINSNPDRLSPIPTVNRNKLAPIICFDSHVRGTEKHVNSVTDHAVATASPPPQRSEVVSVVTVECVTETWLNGDGLGFTDEARVMRMEVDECPSFITNGRDMVVWTNNAYREMTAGGVEDKATAVVVKKYNRVAMPVCLPAFTCKVKVTWGTSNLTAPCDVWRLQTGGYAWRLDVKAALSLGR